MRPIITTDAEYFEHHRANFHSFSKRHVFSPHKNPPTAVEKNFTEADDIKRLIYSDSLRFSAVHKRCRRDFPGHTELNISDNSAPKDRWAVPSINRPTIETKTLTNSGVNTDPLGSLANFLSASDRSRHSSAQSSTSPHTPIAAANDALSSDASTGHGGVGQRNFVLNAAEQAVSSTPCREPNERRDFGSQTHHSTDTLVKNPPRSIATTLGLQSSSETNQLEFLTGSLTQLSDMESFRRFAVDRSEAAGLAYLFQTQQGSRCRHVADVGVAIKPQLQSVGVSVDLWNARSSPPAPPLLEGISADVDECTRIELPFREKSPKGKSASPRPIPSEHWLYSGEMGPDHAKGDTRSRSDTVSTSIPRVYEENATATSDTSRAPVPDRRYSGSDAEFVSDEHEHTVTRSLLTNRSRSGRNFQHAPIRPLIHCFYGGGGMRDANSVARRPVCKPLCEKNMCMRVQSRRQACELNYRQMGTTHTSNDLQPDSPTPVNTPSRVDSTCTDAGISVHSVTEADDLTAATSAASASAAATEPEDELTISEVQSKASDEHRRPTEESNHESFCPASGDDTNRLFTSESALNVTLAKTPKYSEETHDDRSTEDDLEETSGKEFGSSDSLESESVRLPELKQASEHSDSPTVVASSDVLRTAVRYAAIVEDDTSEPNESDLYRAAEPCCVPSMEQLSENLAAKTLVRSPTVRIGSVSNVEDVRPASAIGQSNELTKATDYKTPLLTKADQQKTLFRQNLVDDVTNTLFSEILSGVIDSAISHSRDTLAVHEHKHFADHPITITTDDSGKASSDVVSSPRLHPASAVAFPLDEEFLVDNDDTTSDTVSIGSLFTAEHLRGLVPDIPSRTAYLVHEAVEYLWRARSDATEKLQERAIESAICHPPESFSFTQTDEADLDSTLHSTPDLRFVSRRLIFDLIAEFVQQVYSQEPIGSHGSPSIGKSTKPRVTSAQFRLWKGPNRPETFDALLCLVQNHLHQQLGLQSCFSNPQNPRGHTDSSIEPVANFHLDNLSRLTQWSLSKKSAFDRLLELELRAEECSWLAYGPIEKRLKNALAEEIWDEMLQEAVSSMVEISRKSAPPPYHLSD
ncbi:unnamed protein product [Dicrocoelium dendriticum]|nr:unnamed protein product [Dicrocoelium dendriticum]